MDREEDPPSHSFSQYICRQHTAAAVTITRSEFFRTNGEGVGELIVAWGTHKDGAAVMS